jgi:hypothetical protein
MLEKYLLDYNNIINNINYNLTQKCIILYLNKIPINLIYKLLNKEYRLIYNIIYQFCKKNNILFSTYNNKENNKLNNILLDNNLIEAFNNLKIIK